MRDRIVTINYRRFKMMSTDFFPFNVKQVGFLSELARRGGGVPNKVFFGDAPPKGPTPYRFIHHFWQKRCPFRIPSTDKWYPPFHIPSLGPCTTLNSCKCTVLKIWVTEPWTFLDFFTATNSSISPFRCFIDGKTDFPALLYTSY